MSNQFYRYLSEKLFKYFEDNLVEGSKFFINFEDVYFDKDDEQHNENPVLDLYSSLKSVGKEHNCCKKFKYKHHKGNKYFETYYLNINNINLVVVENISVKNSFISLLRNQIKEQKDEWEHSSLLIIAQKANDTISKGTSNLRDDGMPFSVSVISENLQNEIDNSDLHFHEKHILSFYLEDLNNNFSKNIWHYKSLLSVLKKGKIDDSDLFNLNLFPDSLFKKNYKTETAIKKRLSENRELFNKIPWWKLEPDLKKLKKEFDDDGVDLLNREDWYESDYPLLIRSIESRKSSNNPLKYIIEADKEITEDLACWDVQNSNSAFGKRNRNIIIFNDKCLSTISFNLNFNKHTKGNFIDESCREYVTAPHGKKLTVDLNLDPKATTFKKVIYAPKYEDDDNEGNKGKVISAQRHIFRIVVIPVNESFLESIKPYYKIKDKKHILIDIEDDDLENLIFGSNKKDYDKIIIGEEDNNVFINKDESICISDNSYWEEDKLSFNLIFGDCKIPFMIKKNSMSFPNDSSFIWNLKRQNKTNLVFNGVKIFLNAESFNITDDFKKYLNFEKEIVSNKIIFGKLVENSIIKEDIEICSELRDAYYKICDYYNKIDNVPSLVYIDEDLEKLYHNFINIFNEEVGNIDTRNSLAEDITKLNLINVGRIDSADKILYSSLSPLNITYQLEILKKANDEILESNIYEKLTPRNLIPYLYSDNSNDLYIPIFHKIHEWLIFKKNEEVSIGTTDEFIPKTVEKQLIKFKDHFPYLFNSNFENNILPILKINVIDIDNDRGVVEGVFNFILDHLDESHNNGDLISVEINIYNDSETSEFDTFFTCKTKEDLDSELKIKFKDVDSYNSVDLIRLIQDNIKYSIHSSNADYEYAHISFYKVKVNSRLDEENDIIVYNRDDLETGLYLDGTLSSVTSTNKDSKYRTGFGTKNILNPDNLLVKTAMNMNIIAENSKKHGENVFSPNLSIVTKLSLQNDKIDKIYDNSRWVTFIDPNFGIEYFEDSKGGLIIVHYSDQYTSSDKYDTITVTNKVDHYDDLIKEFLNPNKWGMDPNSFPEDLTPVIRMFNCINGEWLLDIISNTSEHNPEKLSFISAIKYSLAILDHDDIIWIPVSMEELLRISGTYNLARSKGLISQSRKNTGEHSDDLLFIGLRFIEDDIELMFFPVEVKVGFNYSAVIDKGINQIISASNFFKEILSKDTEHDFRNKVYRNYFMQKFLANNQNFILNSLWDEKQLKRVDKFKSRLLNDDFVVSWDFEKLIGKGYVISFQKDLARMFIEEKDDVSVIHLPKSLVYDGLIDSIEEICLSVHDDHSEFNKEKFLKYKLK